MGYWIYETRAAGEARRLVLHAAACSSCQDAESSGAADGRWHGRFDMLANARWYVEWVEAPVKIEHWCVS
jgi:hypothetical protein